MSSTVQKLTKLGLISPPAFLATNTHYETIVGSIAYGVADATADMDIYGFCIPPKNILFPHLTGEIMGFGRQKKRFEQYQQHHIVDKNRRREYDLSIYNIVKYFQLCMDNNPNMIDSLFTPQECVLHITKVGQMVRDERRSFLHKGSFHKFRGYSYSQLHKMGGKNPEVGSKRHVLREEFGFDVKFAYHVVRLLDEAEQILTEGDIDLRRNKEMLKAIRRGEMREGEIRSWASSKEADLEKAYANSTLRHGPDEPRIKQLLIDCLEEHYGCLDDAIVQPGKATQAISDISEIIRKYNAIHEK